MIILDLIAGYFIAEFLLWLFYHPCECEKAKNVFEKYK
jgi:hypothetical protein